MAPHGRPLPWKTARLVSLLGIFSQVPRLSCLWKRQFQVLMKKMVAFFSSLKTKHPNE